MASRGHTRLGYYHPHQKQSHRGPRPSRPVSLHRTPGTFWLSTHLTGSVFMPPRGMQPFWLMAKQKKKFEVHYTSESESSDPPSYILPLCSAALASPRSKFNAGDPNEKEETSGLGPQPCHPVASSLYPPLLPVAPKEESHWGRSPNSGRLMSKKGGAPAASLCPLCQVPGPPPPQADGLYMAGPMQYVYQSFTTTDLLNWRQHTPAYSEEPQAVIELLDNIMHSHQPNWDDCRPLMSTFFTSGEHR
jgi:hypothetical protein